MKFLLEILVFFWILLRSIDAKKNEYYDYPMSHNWTTAWNVCEVSGHFLLPDLGLDGFKKSGIFDDFDVEELVWLNAKDVEISYSTTGRLVHLKFAQIPADSQLTAYLCRNAKDDKMKKQVDLSPLSWIEAYNKCNSSDSWTLFSITSSKQVKKAVSLLKKDVPFWVDKPVKGRIPNMDKWSTDEKCLGVMKMPDGTLVYKRDNCSNKHRFVSVQYADNFALSLTKLTTPYPLLSGEIQPELDNDTIITRTNDGDNSNGDKTSSGGMTGVIVGGVIGGVLVICCAIVAIYFFRRRWRSRRDYLRSLQRYTQRHASSRGLLHGTISHGNTLTVPFQNSSACTPDPNDTEPMPEEYEDCDKRKYADCQNDVVKEIRSRYTKIPGQPPGSRGQSSSSTGLEMLPAYQPMNGKNALQVLPAYERYDPDLQQVHGYVNKENPGQLPEQEQYDNIPDLPKKSGKKPNINDLDTYENHSTENNSSIVGRSTEDKHLGDPDRSTVCSLEELEQYENYQIPKRERGRFRLIKSNKTNKSTKVTKQGNELPAPASLNDLQAYETVESDPKKEIKELADLDAYENFAVK